MSRKPKWNKYTLPLPATHTWKCSPGYTLFIGDRGAVRFEFPQGWLHGPEDDGSIGFHDRKPPDDDVSLKVSVIRLPPGTNLADLNRELPVERMIVSAIEAGDEQPAAEHKDAGRTFDGVVHRVAKPDADVCWVETAGPDPANGRLVRSRTCLGRARGVQPVLTMDCWADLVATYDPVWDHLMATLMIAVPVAGIGGGSAN